MHGRRLIGQPESKSLGAQTIDVFLCLALGLVAAFPFLAFLRLLLER